MTSPIVLNVSVSAVFNAGGVAVARVQNGGISPWKVNLLNISTSSANRTDCKIMRNGSYQVDATQNLGNLNASNTDLDVAPGEYLEATWTGGTPGAIATFAVQGKNILQGKRIY